jgi:DNA-binding transcriptional ArsR family regulator
MMKEVGARTQQPGKKKAASRQSEPKRADLELTALLYALSDATRLQIVRSLAKTDEIACGYFEIDMPKSSLSHHFRVLRNAGVITTRREGTALLNRLRSEDLNDRFPGLLKSILSAAQN